MVMSGDFQQREIDKFVEDGSGNTRVRVSANLENADIEIGAVEIKDGASDQRAAVDASGSLQVTHRDGNGNNFFSLSYPGVVNIAGGTNGYLFDEADDGGAYATAPTGFVLYGIRPLPNPRTYAVNVDENNVLSTKITDGVANMPLMDKSSSAGYVQITDTSNVAQIAVNGATPAVSPAGFSVYGLNSSGKYTTLTFGSNGELPVDVSFSKSLTPGTATANLGKAEDAVHNTGDTGVAVWARRIDTLANSAGSSGDYATFNQDSTGAMYVNPESTNFSNSKTSTTTGAGTTITCTHCPKRTFAIQCKGTNTQVGTTTWTIVLEGSLNNADWTTLITHTYPTDADGVTKFVADMPVRYYRCNVTALTLGTATNVVTTIVGVN